MATSLFFATPRTKDVDRNPCPTNAQTYTLYSSSFHGRLSPQISFCDPHPTVFFFLPLDTNRLRGEISFRPEPLRKPPYEPSRVDIQFYYNFKKYIHRYAARVAQRWSSTPFTRFQRCSLIETGRWKEIFFHGRKLEKWLARPEIKMPHMRTSVLQPL